MAPEARNWCFRIPTKILGQPVSRRKSSKYIRGRLREQLSTYGPFLENQLPEMATVILSDVTLPETGSRCLAANTDPALSKIIGPNLLAQSSA
jgi:hypothetical protein